MGFYTRHPRYTFCLILCLFTTALLLTNTSPGTYPPLRALGYRRPPDGMFTEDKIKENELFYQESLKDRQKLITKYGPTVGQVDSFPAPETGDFYTLWDFFTPAFACPHRVERIGTLGDGGKWVCGVDRIAKKKDCVIYSIGINGESSFEASILERAPGCQVYGYDFSVSSFGPEIESIPDLAARTHFQPYALGGIDAHSESDSPQTYTLPTLMSMNGHSFIDILKVDIEGAEFDTMNALLSAFPDGLPFGQLQLEIHARDGEYARFWRFLHWWQNLEAAGLRPFWTEPNLVYVNLIRARPDLAEYSFINIRGQHTLISDEA